MDVIEKRKIPTLPGTEPWLSIPQLLTLLTEVLQLKLTPLKQN
jgi:hypothetical protein